MHIIDKKMSANSASFKGFLLLSAGLLTLSSATSVIAATTDLSASSDSHMNHNVNYSSQHQLAAIDHNHDAHKNEHGGQVYQTTKLENAWLIDENGQGNLESKFETLIGTDENRVFVEANVSKAESDDSKYDISSLYSRNVAKFWDAQAGIRYREDKGSPDKGRFDAVIGIMGLAPYFFETQAYLYAGENSFLGASLEFDRDLLLTQKLITQPYIEADMVFNDDANYASKTGLSELRTGIKTRYEISKRIKPFVDVAYQYEKGYKASALQSAAGLTTKSEKNWLYGVGVELMF